MKSTAVPYDTCACQTGKYFANDSTCKDCTTEDSYNTKNSDGSKCTCKDTSMSFSD